MNFASKLMAKAEEAAEAAKNFKGFDEMADEDEYIHSEGLNVKGQNQKDQQQQQHQDREEANSLADSNISAEPTWSLLDRPAVASQSAAPENSGRGRTISRNASTISSTSPASSISPPPRQRPPPARPKFTQPTPQPAAPARSAMSYMSVVADALESRPISEAARQTNRQQSSFSGYDTDNEESVKHQEEESSSSSSSDDSSDDEDDAILSQIRQSKSGSSREKRHRKKNKKRKKKDPNRFMEELNRRGPTPIPGSSSAAEFSRKQQQKQQALEMEPLVNATDDNNSGSGGGRMANLKKWISPFQRNSPDSVVAKATSFLKKGPLSRRDPEAPPPPEEADGVEEFQVVAGSSVLSDDELQALAQMNSQSKMSMLSPMMLMPVVKKNPREAFIVFTMLLAIFVFFFTRKTSNENDVQ